MAKDDTIRSHQSKSSQAEEEEPLDANTQLYRHGDGYEIVERVANKVIIKVSHGCGSWRGASAARPSASNGW